MPFTSNLGVTPEGEDDMDEGPGSKRVIICANVLPLDLEKDDKTGKWQATWNTQALFEDGPMYTALQGLDNEVLYVGCPQAFIPRNERDEVEALMQEHNCYPVWCDAQRAHNHFQGYCKGILWPVFHNVIDLYSRIEPKVLEDDPLHERYVQEQQQLQLGATAEEQNADGNGNKDDEKSWQPARSWSPMEAEMCWPDYCAMNGLFAQRVVELHSTGDTIWAHDYHLLVLPNYLLRKIPNAKIALFVHVPFPSSEIFRTLATREEILRAMLCADHIGFDLFEYARHFFTCCKRMLGLTYEAKKGGIFQIDNNGRKVAVTCSHVGIDTKFVKHSLTSPKVQTMAQRIALGLVMDDQEYADAAGGSSQFNALHQKALTADRRHLLVGIDEVEGLRGIGLKLLALDRLFTDYAHLRGRVLLRQIGLKLDSRPDDYKRCHQEVESLISKICKKWGPVVEYEERTLVPLEERLAIFQNADVFVSTCVRVGIDMLPFEYLMARKNPAGCIILSEFSACSRVLHGSLRVNPFKTSALAATIEEALSMSLPERTARCARDLEFVERNGLLDWGARILQDVEDAHHDTSEPLTKFGGGFGTRVLFQSGVGGRQSELDSIEAAEAYKNAKRRLILIDYSGTLVETSSLDMYMKRGGTARSWHYEKGGSRRPGGCLETRDPISDTARSVLVDLCRDKNNTVVVISSDLRDELDHALQGIRNLALIAENGFVFRLSPGQDWIPAIDTEHVGGGDWYGGNSSKGFYEGSQTSGSGSNHSGGRGGDRESVDGDSSEGASVYGDDYDHTEMEGWQALVRDIMSSYATRTNGGFVWSSPSAVSFNCILSDPELGSLQASNLVLELEARLALMPLTIEQGKGFVTVRLRGVNRGAACRELIAYLNSHASSEDKQIDFVASFGDDTEDESTFLATNKYRVNDSSTRRFSVRVGSSNHSKARYFLPHSDDVVDLLNVLTETSSNFKVRRNFSHGDFKTQDGANILGHFKTKQSYVQLPQGETCPVNGADQVCNNDDMYNNGKNTAVAASQSASNLAGFGASPKPGMKPSPSYVASAKEMEELFGTQSPQSLSPSSAQHFPPTMSSLNIDVGDDDGDGLGMGMGGPPLDPRAIPPTSPTNMDHDDGDGGFNDDDYDEDEDDTAHGGIHYYDKVIGSGRQNAQNGRASSPTSPMRRQHTSASQRSSSDALEAAFHQAILHHDEAPSSSNSHNANDNRTKRRNGYDHDEKQIDDVVDDDNDDDDDDDEMQRLETDYEDWLFNSETTKLLLAALSGAGLSYVFFGSKGR